ncbi:Nuclear Hormone Receptor family [Caenorhabditis elegans]|uniref:Nuclear Hormone Receptor family n=1 Tax=Caenorhabditis elegans TaxID=6239 RepID=O44638_CAEEL|nr:Nuclear Hormone Receptor family [Caenorhabditis elegans]AAO39207.1 nuclear receptor NHR-117 [Caenorhabditis elegans]CCD69578.1 Nuclear Hormone Receptor family [Caenorhabditis elegans]|eukprot:NP_001294719.1 Nuclear Hormone Receptor family [Caenorhabditis elegans]
MQNSIDFCSASSSTSSNYSSPPAVLDIDQVLEKCQICYQPGHGYHFGAFICRACAAFFRRCHFSLALDQRKCRLLSGSCQPNKNGRWFCKKCRFDKCLELGMTTTNIQYDRDAFKSSASFLKNKSVAKRVADRVSVPMQFSSNQRHVIYNVKNVFQTPPTALGKAGRTLDETDQRILCQNTVESALGINPIMIFTYADENKQFPFIDISQLVDKALSSILTPISVRKIKKMSNLEQLTQGLDEFQWTQKESVSQIVRLSANDHLNDFQTYMCAAAKWLSYSDRIRNLDDELKIQILQCIWFNWGRLERIATTAKMRNKRKCGKKQFVFSNNILLDYDEMSSDLSFWSNYTFEEMKYFFIPTEMFYDEVICEMEEVQPDNMETTFIISLMCFHLTGKQFGGQVQEEMDQLQDLLSDELHEYYLKKNMTMYSLRLKQLMKIKEKFLKLRYKRCEKYKIAGIFEAFHTNLSNPEFFMIPA